MNIGLRQWIVAAGAALLFVLASCGGGGNGSLGDFGSSSRAPSSEDICACVPSAGPEVDYRHAAKHVILPGTSGQDIHVSDMLAWPAPAPDPPGDAPRSGRELQMFRLAHVFVHFVWIVGSDCDVHAEVADTPDPNAPRVIVEVPIESFYCPNRQLIKSDLAARGVQLVGHTGITLPQPLPAEVVGMAFRDFNHARGTQLVASPWELHPAIIRILPQ